MSWLLDIFIMPSGCAITLFKMFQLCVVYLETNEMDYNQETYESKAIDISISIYKFSTHLHLVIAERNLCQDVQLAKS